MYAHIIGPFNSRALLRFAWCRSAHTHIIDTAINDALQTVTGCLRPTPTTHQFIWQPQQPPESLLQGGFKFVQEGLALWKLAKLH